MEFKSKFLVPPGLENSTTQLFLPKFPDQWALRTKILSVFNIFNTPTFNPDFSFSSDLYEGTRMATATDLPGIREIMQPLEESGALVRRTDEELLEAINSFIVVERDGSIIASAALFPYFEEKCAEVAAIAVSPECRGHGQGDKLLDYMEKKASSLGLEKLFLLTTRAADWFVRRGFSECSIEAIPEARRRKINLLRRSKYYIKMLQPDSSGITVDKVSLWSSKSRGRRSDPDC